MDVCINERKEMKVSPNFVHTNHLKKRDLWDETIQVWDYLVENNYRPADFSCGRITMNIEGFARLAGESDGLVSVKETNIYRSNALWIGNIEINYTEFKTKQSGCWTLTELWEPL